MNSGGWSDIWELLEVSDETAVTLPTLPICKPVVPYAGIIIINGDTLLAQMSNNGNILQGPTSPGRDWR